MLIGRYAYGAGAMLIIIKHAFKDSRTHTDDISIYIYVDINNIALNCAK